jgi:hypothetical protein
MNPVRAKRGEGPAASEQRRRRNQGRTARWRSVGGVLCGAVLVLCPAHLFAADTITGAVRNGTSGQPAAGDEVVLLDLKRSPHEEARAKTDSQGGFTLSLPDAGRPHLIRVLHEGVNYDRMVSAGGAISMEVFDASAHAEGITGGIEIIRAGTLGAGTQENSLHVSDMIEIKNESSPPVTRRGEKTFEVYLPGDATLESVLAAGPENIPASIAATAVRGEPGHFSVNFPLRPGSTKFAFNYDLSYSGQARFRARNMYPLEQLAVMIPPTMRFTSRTAAFRVLPLGNQRYHVEAAERVKAESGLEFEVSGVGALPEIPAQNHSSPSPPAGAGDPAEQENAGPAAARRPDALAVATGAAPQLSARPSLARWWIVGTAGALVFEAWILLALRRRHGARLARVAAELPPGAAGQEPALLVGALKDGLFQLETDRIEGAIRGEDYAAAKRSLEGTIQWALGRRQGSKASDG